MRCTSCNKPVNWRTAHIAPVVEPVEVPQWPVPPGATATWYYKLMCGECAERGDRKKEERTVASTIEEGILVSLLGDDVPRALESIHRMLPHEKAMLTTVAGVMYSLLLEHQECGSTDFGGECKVERERAAEIARDNEGLDLT